MEISSDIKAAAAALGRKGGLKGGKARAKSLSAEERSSIAKKAAAARWSNHINKNISVLIPADHIPKMKEYFKNRLVLLEEAMIVIKEILTLL